MKFWTICKQETDNNLDSNFELQTILNAMEIIPLSPSSSHALVKKSNKLASDPTRVTFEE